MLKPAIEGKHHIKRSRVKRITLVVGFVFVQAAVLFASAGTFTWLRAWIYITFYVVILAVAGVSVVKMNPELVGHRAKIKSDTKRFDKVFYIIFTPMLFVMLVIAGFDAVRFQWSSMPGSLAAAGIAMGVPAYSAILWAMVTNVHFESTVRIQKDRNHQVVTTGPYQYVRHPGYVGMIFMYSGIPLILGSWWAFAPDFVLIALVIIRTALEDNTLQRELPGYTEYSTVTRYRLLPGIW